MATARDLLLRNEPVSTADATSAIDFALEQRSAGSRLSARSIIDTKALGSSEQWAVRVGFSAEE